MEQLLAGKNAFITGAGANIGRAIALEMAAQGATICFAEQDTARCAALEEELRAAGTQTHGFVCDASRPEHLEDVLGQLARRKIVVDILVNNVGIGTEPSLETSPSTFAEWGRVMDTNVLAPLYLSRAVAARLIEDKRPGSIVFITSIHQWVFHGTEVYSASKAALSMIIDELAVPLARHNIRVNGIAPGSCTENPDGTPTRYSGAPLYGQAVRPCYIGRAAVFLCSDYFSHHTTGAVLKVDGGLSLYSFRSRDLITPPPSGAFPALRRGASRLRRWARSLHDARETSSP